MIYLRINWAFTLPLIIDQQMDFWPAMQASWKRVGQHWWSVFGLALLVWLISVAGLLVCCVGVLFTAPIGVSAMMYGYETLFRPANGDPLTGPTAWGCLTTNLALPGFGSLLGRRLAGYFQAPLCVLGVVGTLVFGGRFLLWYFTHRAMINDPQTDPFFLLHALWVQVRWALLAMGAFAVAWLWALGTSLSLLLEAKNGTRRKALRPQRHRD